jgi:hypothetical protein
MVIAMHLSGRYAHHHGKKRNATTDSVMEHFSIVQALCRAAMADASPALRKQVERLRGRIGKRWRGQAIKRPDKHPDHR